MSDNPLLDAALKLAAKGIPVFPCKNAPGVEGHKAPLIKSGFKAASCREVDITLWWTKHPNALIGVPTGTVSGIVVLDLDVKNGKNGLEHVQDWESLSPVIARTGSGGIHLFFRSDGTVRNSSDKIASGVDTRGEGGYVIAAPSPGYEWVKGDLSIRLPPFPDRFRPATPQGEPTPNAEAQADIGRVRAAATAIPNENVGWEDWNRIGMALFRATGGSQEGRRAFHEWSSKSTKYDPRATDDRWNGYFRSPPDKIGAGTIFHEARAASPDWESAWWVVEEARIKAALDAAANAPIEEQLAWFRERAANAPAADIEPEVESAPPPSGDPEPEPEPPPSDPTSAPPPRLSLLKTSADFVRDFIPPDYLIDGLLQTRFLYSLTAPTGSGKTCVALRLAAHVALGLPLGAREVMQGNVVYFAGENPDDVRVRFIKQCEDLGRKPEDVPVLFLDTRAKLSSDTIRTKIKNDTFLHKPVSLVVVDTSAAFFEGDDENQNTLAGNHARMLRGLINDVAGGPTILVTCHPTKTPDLSNLLPRGGGAFLAEVDGNLVLLKENMVVEMTWHGKFRGPDFAPISFRLKSGIAQSVKDKRGRPLATVTAEPITAAEREAMDERSDANMDSVLAVMEKNPGISISGIATKLGWTYATGEPNKSHVKRLLVMAAKAKLVTLIARKWTLTKAGREAVAAAEARPL